MDEFECPTCSRVFETRRGLGVHHSSVHGDRLPNRECGHCGTEFYCEYERVYCSERCYNQGVSREGAANPNYSGGKTETTCESCGDDFEYYPSEKDGLYCGGCVEAGSWRNPPVLSGSDNPMWGGGMVEVDCAVCGSVVERYPSQLQGEVTLCDDSCRHEWLSEAFQGEGHPNWKGGTDTSYGPGWNRVRREALERDGYTCMVCGTDREEIGRNPDVHHIVPVRAFATAEDRTIREAHDLQNVISLCVSCHRQADFGHIGREQLHALIAER